MLSSKVAGRGSTPWEQGAWSEHTTGAVKAADLRRLAVSLHLDDGQSLETAAQNTRMSRRSLTRFLSYVAETGDVHYAPEKWNTHADNFLRCPDLRSAVLFAVEQFPEAFLNENSDFVTHLH